MAGETTDASSPSPNPQPPTPAAERRLDAWILARLNELEKPFELKLYWGTGHAFTLYGEAQGRWWHAEHAEDAFREAVLFLRRRYGLPVGTVERLTPGAAPTVGAPA